MIKVKKSPSAPESLSTTQRYDGEDVKQQLLSDQYCKCYICERVRDTDFEIEHHKSETNFSELKQDWNNLFLSCRYCNGKKLQYYDNMLNPAVNNIEDEIEQQLNFAEGQAIFTAVHDTSPHAETIMLLNSVFNGTKRVRRIKEQRFFEHALSVVNQFLSLVNTYLAVQTAESAEAVRNELSIDREFLGFKYWIIKGNPTLSQVFANEIVWNK